MNSDFISSPDRVSEETLLEQAFELTGEARDIKLVEAAEALRLKMEELGSKLKDLILSQSFEGLLGYLWGNLLMGVPSEPDDDSDSRIDVETHRATIILALEYLHAVASCFDEPFKPELDENIATEIVLTAERLKEISILYSLASSRSRKGTGLGDLPGSFEYKAKTAWLLIRSNRYQVLEGEFFLFVLEPHDDALRLAYGVGAAEIASGMQAIADSMREGFARSFEGIEQRREATLQLADERGIPWPEALDNLRQEAPEEIEAIGGHIRDLFFGGFCNISRHTSLPESILVDLSFRRGENREFFSPEPLSGTPFRTLPARIKPLIDIQGGFYATDPNFVRDAAYRALKRGLDHRVPEYEEEWNRRQKSLTEEAFQRIFGSQLEGAWTLSEVYYRDPRTGNWVENDTLILLGDVLILVEAKAGIGAMFSPAENFNSHVRAIQNLVLKAYRQTKRFCDYLASSLEVQLFEFCGGEYLPIRSIRLADFRIILPIGLTVESFSPFSAMCKELPEIEPLLGSHPFVSMSIDDCLVLNRFLPTTGELFHYLAVRQRVAGIREASLFDELDHLGAYIAKNRFDLTIRKQLADGMAGITWDGFSRVIDQYFEGDLRSAGPLPRQSFPEEVERLLGTLAKTRAPGWLRMDSFIRDFSDEARVELARMLSYLAASLKDYDQRWYLLDQDNPLLIWISVEAPSDLAAMIQQAEIAALALGKREVLSLRISATRTGDFTAARGLNALAPLLVRKDYQELVAKADALRARIKSAPPNARGGPKIKLGPNEKCWCGSMRKFKKCHGAPKERR